MHTIKLISSLPLIFSPKCQPLFFPTSSAFEKKKSHWIHFVCRTWGLGNLSWAASLKKTDSPSSMKQQLPKSLQLMEELHEFLHYPCWDVGWLELIQVLYKQSQLLWVLTWLLSVFWHWLCSLTCYLSPGEGAVCGWGEKSCTKVSWNGAWMLFFSYLILPFISI